MFHAHHVNLVSHQTANTCLGAARTTSVPCFLLQTTLSTGSKEACQGSDGQLWGSADCLILLHLPFLRNTIPPPGSVLKLLTSSQCRWQTAGAGVRAVNLTCELIATELQGCPLCHARSSAWPKTLTAKKLIKDRLAGHAFGPGHSFGSSSAHHSKNHGQPQNNSTASGATHCDFRTVGHPST